MTRSTRLMLAVTFATTVFATLSPTSRAETTDPRVAPRVMMLTRATKWTQVAAIKIPFNTFHPQGMVKIGRDFFVSSVEVQTSPRKLPVPTDGHDVDTGAGIGHLFKIGSDGRLISDLILGEGPIYHPGGIDYDGASIWAPVAEYRPDSRAIIYKISPVTMTAKAVFTINDHIGGVVHDTVSGRIEGISWGSRRFYSWPIPRDGAAHRAPTTHPIANPDNYIDYQDCHYAGGRRALCAGVADYSVKQGAPAFQLGGIDVVDLSTHQPVWQVPIALWAPSGRVMTQNPFWIEATATGLRAYFMPDDYNSTIFVFDATVT